MFNDFVSRQIYYFCKHNKYVLYDHNDTNILSLCFAGGSQSRAEDHLFMKSKLKKLYVDYFMTDEWWTQSYLIFITDYDS